MHILKYGKEATAYYTDDLLDAIGTAKSQAVRDYTLKHGVACGGNWTLMLLSAVRYGNPTVYETLDNHKDYSFIEMHKIIVEQCLKVN